MSALVLTNEEGKRLTSMGNRVDEEKLAHPDRFGCTRWSLDKIARIYTQKRVAALVAEVVANRKWQTIAARTGVS